MMSWQVRFGASPLGAGQRWGDALQRECLTYVTLSPGTPAQIPCLPVGLRPTQWQVGSLILALLCLWG